MVFFWSEDFIFIFFPSSLEVLDIHNNFLFKWGEVV
jgi:hypothetical protein